MGLVCQSRKKKKNKRQRSHHKANSCIKACFPLAWTIYFRLPSHPYLLSEFTVESRNMGNRLFRGWGWWQGAGAGGARKKNKELEKRQAKLLWVVHYRGKRGDGERLIGWCRQKAKCRSELGKQSGFVVSDSDAFDSWESVTAIMKPSLTYGPKLYSNSTKCHLSSKMHGAGCVCVGLPGFVCWFVGIHTLSRDRHSLPIVSLRF